MKAEVGDYLFWEGKLAKVITETNGQQVMFEFIEESKCPHCQGNIGKERISVNISSLLFQTNAKPVKSIKV